jgi:hypothetical protein
VRPARSKNGEALKQPEHGDAADGEGWEELEAGRGPGNEALQGRDRHKGQGDEEKVTRLDAEAEKEQGERDVAVGGADSSCAPPEPASDRSA